MSVSSRRGKALIEKGWGSLPPPSPLMKDIAEITERYLFGEIWSRPGLKVRDRSMITIAALTVLGRERQLRSHLRASFKLGLTRNELKEMMLHLANYGGWASGVTGLIILEEILAEKKVKSASKSKHHTKK